MLWIKKYTLLRFLNKDHGVVVRTFFGVGGYVITLIVSRSNILALDSLAQFRANNFKTGFRRLAWTLRSYLGLNIANDKVYNFTENLAEDALLALDQRLSKRLQHRPDDLILLSDKVYIMAALMEVDGKYFESLSAQYDETATKIIQLQREALDNKIEKAPRLTVIDSGFKVEHARTALADFAKIYDVDDHRWFATGGTLLGLIREGGFLTHDYDIDLGVFGSAFVLDEFLNKVQDDKNFIVKKLDFQRTYAVENGKFKCLGENIVLVKLVHHTHINLDLFIHYEDGSAIWHGSSYHKWENSNFELQKYELGGVELFGPADTDRYLTEHYGDWRTPVSEFNCSTGTTNLVIVHNPSTVALFVKRIALAENSIDLFQAVKVLQNSNAIGANFESQTYKFFSRND